MTIIPVVHAEADDIAKKLTEILGIGEEKGGAKSDGAGDALDLVRARFRQTAIEGAAIAGGGMPKEMPGGVPGGAAGARASGKSHEPKIIADERTNSLIVVADDDMTARVRAVVSQLDSELDMSGFRYYVYRCQHASAEELSEVLSGLVGGSGGGGSTSTKSSGSNLVGGGGDSEGGLGTNSNSRNRGGKASSTLSRK